jgi:uncharacterized membrane protein HdeD (DUF308 family)
MSLPRDNNDPSLQPSNPTDCRRLMFLGLIVVLFGAITFADEYRPRAIVENLNGISAIYGGVAIIIVILKLGRGKICIDWILAAAFYFGTGLVVRSDNTLPYTIFSILLCTLFLLSAFSRISIGLSASLQGAAVWMFYSGILATIGAILIGIALAHHMRAAPQFIISLDTIFLGVSIANFGYWRQSN